MTVELVMHLVSLFRSSASTELEYRDESIRLSLKHSGKTALATAEAEHTTVEESVSESDLLAVKASSTGIFLTQHPLALEPVVKPGQLVTTGDVVGFLEIDQVLSCATTPEDGEVSHFAAVDGEIAGFGSELVSVRRASASY
ncbi:hypothetical protein [Cupriavidus taiwanensis]|uniref:Lipoyl-binding domain-containing protein n=1 Tax=Cupriavidus taiwanensis TaxID=164546 RepID=A0A7Z7NQD8_9BURK|nr:hypothetical protein [Cupriavidus taiwanensis]SOZ19521.1 hypothetical protein CBM2597_U60017 [Cupriavidus taiwanensis]SOZ97291.1 hypothetical protein CBM2598_U60014 [Cupriavidus taiwanensis]SPC26180.1 hypothetical protein CBM2594_U70013 [Cupriavidus taiwanensis]SPD37688.1 protein of unknown function [Cupriavidus taiwanensis]